MYGVSRLDVQEDVALVSFHSIPLNLDVLGEIFVRFADAGINIDMISQTAPMGGKVNISFTCLDKDMVKVLEIAKSLNEKFAGVRPMVSAGNCKLQLYGEDMPETTGVFAKALSCLRNTNVELRQISTSEVDISLLFGAVHLDDAISALNSAFGLAVE